MQRKARIVALATTAVFAAGAASASAETVIGLTDSDKLVAFDSTTPGTIAATRTVTGLAANDSLVGIDYRPATLQLYGVGAPATGGGGQLYRIDVSTGAATAIGARFTAAQLGDADEYDIDFNPTVDRLRITSNAAAGDNNIRVNPNTGVPTDPDDGNINPGTSNIVASAYENNHPASGTYPAAPTTVLYNLDATTNGLTRQVPPNDGTQVPVGPLGVDIGNVAGFDISTNPADSADTGYVVVRTGAAQNPSFHTVNLTTGTASAAIGTLGTTDKLGDIAVVPATPGLVVLGSGTPQTLSTLAAVSRPNGTGALSAPVNITGLQAGEKLLGIDTRPSDGKLFGLGSTSRLYTLDARTGAATAVGTAAFTPAVANEGVGFDFNPTTSSAAIRILRGTDNFAVNATSGVATSATALNAQDGLTGTLNVRDAAYTKEVTGATPATRLFGIDIEGNRTVEIGQLTKGGVLAPTFNGGQTTEVGTLGVDPLTAAGGFEAIPRFDQQFAALETTAGKSTLYNINGSITAGGPRANGSAAATGDLALPTGSVADGIALLTPTSGSAVPTPTPTYSVPTPTPTYGVPTPTPTASPTPTPTRKARVKLKGVKVTPKRDRRKPFTFRVRGTVDPVGKAKSKAKGKRLRIVVKRSGTKKIRFNKKVKVNAKGKFDRKVTFRKARKQLGKRKGRLSFRVQFLGNSDLRKSQKVIRSVRYGR